MREREIIFKKKNSFLSTEVSKEKFRIFKLHNFFIFYYEDFLQFYCNKVQ